jgi:hypothetical protein
MESVYGLPSYTLRLRANKNTEKTSENRPKKQANPEGTRVLGAAFAFGNGASMWTFCRMLQQRAQGIHKFLVHVVLHAANRFFPNIRLQRFLHQHLG